MSSTTEVEDVLGTAAAWRAAGEQVAVATVTETWGSSPAPPEPDGGDQIRRMAGPSPGCDGAGAVGAAMKTIDTGSPQLLDFGVSHERAWRSASPVAARSRCSSRN
jgi:xanthine dehydrogenase accessory factor